VTEKIDKLTVFGGLEGVLKDVVRIHKLSARPRRGGDQDARDPGLR
jgi:hypothetical protein